MALNILGYKTYHMRESVDNNDFALWNDILENDKPMKPIFENRKYTACIDFPASVFYEEISKEYPELKFILTRRDSSKWYRSVMYTIWNYWGPERSPILGMFSPYMRGWQRLGVNYQAKIWGKGVTVPYEDKSAVCKKFEEHNEKVIKVLPKEKLLVYELGSGWEPLCKFLGKEIQRKIIRMQTARK
eukprot:UN25222